MTRAATLLLAMALAGCASAPRTQACPGGQPPVRTAQLFLGAGKAEPPADRDLRRFVDQEVTPRFPDGVTVVDGGGQWTGSENRLIRKAAKVVLVVLPASGDGQGKVQAIRTAYRSKFKQDPPVVLPPPACVGL